ncbi:MAG: hypothetical protein VX778_02850, partial [Candidatus Thermoplasmatota archaeon]|nr:hypothetical protein [Candidatus Thermoplasmatota archaeon]
MVCWGADDQGQLGNGGLSTSDQSSPSIAVDLGVGRTAVTVTAGRDHVCALLDDGSVKCWGDDLEGQLGAGLNGNTNYNGFGYDSDVPTPVLLPTGRTAIAVEANYRHTCALLDDGSLTCWGSDWRGELGNGGSNTALDYPSTNPIDLGTGRTAVAVSLGRAHTCAILDNGDAKCWGWDSSGQLGDGGVSTYDGWRHTTSPSSTSIDLGTGRTAVAISAGAYHTCAILDNGTMLCWGEDSSGQLGNGATTGNQGSPVSVAGSYTWDTTTTVSSGSGSTANTLSSSAEGANLIVGIPMTDITFGTNSASSSSLAMG